MHAVSASKDKNQVSNKWDKSASFRLFENSN
jgi:hypothetical protein